MDRAIAMAAMVDTASKSDMEGMRVICIEMVKEVGLNI